MSHRARKLLAIPSLVLALLVPAVAAAGPAAAHNYWNEPYHASVMNKTWTPWYNTWNGPAAGEWPISAGSSVRMHCWNTGAYREGSSKWFWVTKNSYPYTDGYVPANTVSQQWGASPHC